MLTKDFLTKEQYFSLRTSWKTFIKEGGHKQHPGAYYGCIYGAKSRLTSLHHLIYNTLIHRGDFTACYTAAKKHEKHIYGPYGAFRLDRNALSSLIYSMERSPERETIVRFMEPFGDVVTLDILKSVMEHVQTHRSVFECAETK